MLARIAPDRPPEAPSAVIALAASAGGVEALSEVVSGLPRDLDATVLVVLHIAPIGPSVLPSIIGRRSALPASHPADGEQLRRGYVYVAPPDRHLLVVDGHVRLVAGPRENGNRPAADPLFRSVARSHGRHAAGVVLSGALDDGTAGLTSIKRAGGLTVVQDPEEAAFPGMPLNAIHFAEPDRVAKLHDIPAILVKFVEEVSHMEPREDVATDLGPSLEGELPTEFTCPECGGTLWAESDHPLRLRCRVGHSYSTESFAVGKQDAIEAALWAAIVALEERADLARRMLRRFGSARSSRSRRYELDIEQSERGASTLRRMAAELMIPIEEAEGPRGADDRTG